VSEHENTTIANLHRTCAGITAFRVQDPDPNAVDSGNVLGIRFEIFSGKDRAFQTPYYVLLNQPTPNSGHLKVHKHTIPVFIPLQALAKKYLPFNIQDEDNDSGSVKQCPAQDLPKFVRALRKEVVAHHKRIDAYERIQRALGRYPGVGEANMLDATGKEIEILFTNGAVARLRIATDGKVEKVAVGAAPKASSEKALPDLDMKTFREIKKAIEGGDGRIDDLAVRLRSRTKR
jgi:central kinetochore subunit Mal2/MCM21